MEGRVEPEILCSNHLAFETTSWILRPGAENPATSRQPVRHEVVTHVLGTTRYLCLRAGQAKGGGAGGIRTLDRALQPYNGLANRRLQPLGHSSISADMPDAGASRKRQISARRILRHLKASDQ